MRKLNRQKMKREINFDILSLFPHFFDSPLKQSIIGKAIKKGIISVDITDIRDFGVGSRKTVDDRPYGGGVGMVMKVDVLEKATENIRKNRKKPWVILLDPKGKTYDQSTAEKLARKKEMVLVCGHYEGVDERFAENFVDEIISVGDYILTGGEPASLVIIDSVSRLLPNVLGKEESKITESFSKVKINSKEKRILDYPVYTRPEIFNSITVPKTLLSGNHVEIEKWRRKKSLEKTQRLRKDLLSHP